MKTVQTHAAARDCGLPSPAAARSPTACWFLAVESLFEKELRRRGIDASDPSTSKGPPEQQRTATRPAPGFRGAPSEDDYDVPPQLARSRALQSEGLEVGAGGRSRGALGKLCSCSC